MSSAAAECHDGLCRGPPQLRVPLPHPWLRRRCDSRGRTGALISTYIGRGQLSGSQSQHLQSLNGLLVERLPSLPTSHDVAVADADDDVVSDAMRAARLTTDDLFDEDDEDEEDILYVPRPVEHSSPRPRPGSGAPSPPPQTASDLLLSVLSGGHDQATSIWAPPGGESPWRMGRT